MSSGILCVIPARFASSRLPGKPLKRIRGRPLIMLVYDRACESGVFNEVIVATDDRGIYTAIDELGGKAVMTSPAHVSGTDRVNEVAQARSFAHVVNLQGDEPLIPAGLLRELTGRLVKIDDNSLLTCVANATIEESANPNVVKAVLDQRDNALYFSRASIPYDREGQGKGPVLKHIGIYGFSRAGIAKFCSFPKGVLEQREKLEQLRALEFGMSIQCLKTEYDGLGIDTPQDLADFRKRVGAEETD
jgi:3-deoxy-manno-octulosonate cytidylyltransferase (CMP-KDO synthetase)